ncbi:hypothetical protein NDU88_001151 [Pleurodeles waltl]|uniref:Uncharacterized protein n=1 Tax=Pleurodeles waltl TaxID=8319 RepID=A0AAV7KQ68_PLEWA|nr:hypothetical protein NDU88_001151 [Pleurodeles waltl]
MTVGPSPPQCPRRPLLLKAPTHPRPHLAAVPGEGPPAPAWLRVRNVEEDVERGGARDTGAAWGSRAQTLRYRQQPATSSTGSGGTQTMTLIGQVPKSQVPPCATVKYATGATAPVAQLPLRRLDSEPASSWKPLSRWAGWRPEGDRPPAQRESQNYRRGLSTAER